MATTVVVRCRRGRRGLSRSISCCAQSGEDISKTLFTHAIHGRWNEVEEMYENNPGAHSTKITKYGESALHLAVLDDKDEVVKKLIDFIVGTNPDERQHIEEVLGVQNDRGDTALHYAASLGKVKMCHVIASRSPKLVGLRNNEGETPLFVAALNGNKEAFLCLHSLIPQGKGLSYCRRADGDTFLHSALNGDYFDLAFQIIHRYRELGNFVNEQGYSPLHLLANKPSAFVSGSRFGFIDKIIYHCTFVSQLEMQNQAGTSICHYSTAQTENNRTIKFPENYLTCVDFYDIFRHMFKSLGFCKSIAGMKTDAESQVPVRATNQVLPPNYDVIFDFLKLVCKAVFIILGFGYRNIQKMQEKKEKHTWSLQIMEELLKESSEYQYEDNGQQPGNLHLDKDVGTVPYDIHDPNMLDRSSSDIVQSEQEGEPKSIASGPSKETGSGHDKVKRCLEVFPVAITDKDIDRKNVLFLAVDRAGERTRSNLNKRETPILIAAKSGITEMVESIHKQFPLAINDLNIDKKNVVLLAVENRQPHVYQLLRKLLKNNNNVFRRVDSEGNSALHLAARLGGHRPWLIPGAALQMQWELKWYEFVKSSKPLHYFPKYNKKRQTPRDVFTETHESLVEKGGQWLTNTSESCSLVAALIATVAFATASAVPGGVNQDKGTPTLEKQPAFDIFAIASLIALSFSVTSLVMFLSILTSRYQEKDFRRSLPRKLLVGLTSLFLSIAAMLISFCAGHFFVLKDNLRYGAIFIYAVTCLPITLFFAIAQFPLYFDLLWAATKKVPQRSYQVVIS